MKELLPEKKTVKRSFTSVFIVRKKRCSYWWKATSKHSKRQIQQPRVCASANDCQRAYDLSFVSKNKQQQ